MSGISFFTIVISLELGRNSINVCRMNENLLIKYFEVVFMIFDLEKYAITINKFNLGFPMCLNFNF